MQSIICKCSLSFYNQVTLLQCNFINRLTWTQTCCFLGHSTPALFFLTITRILVTCAVHIHPSLPYSHFSCSGSPSLLQSMLLGDLWHGCIHSPLYKYTSHGHCEHQRGSNVAPCKHVPAVYFLPRSALPPPVDLLTNTPDYVTVRSGTLTWWTENTHCEPSPLTAPDWMHIWMHSGPFSFSNHSDSVENLHCTDQLFKWKKKHTHMCTL